MRAGELCIFMVAILWATAAPAQEPLRTPLRWADVVMRLSSLPRIQEAMARTRAAEAGVAVARQVPNPEVEARLGRALPRDGGRAGLEWGIGLSVPFDWVGTRHAEMDAARFAALAAREDARAARLEVLRVLAALFWKVAYGRRLVATIQEAESQAARLADLVRLRVESGEARPSDLLRIEIERERVRMDLDRAGAEWRADRRALAVVLGLPEDLDLEVDPGDRVVEASRDREEAVRRVLRAHPRLLAAQGRVRARWAEIASERARRLPGFAVGGSFDRENDKDAVAGLIQVRLPVWNWNTGSIRRAEAQAEAEERAAEAEARDLVAETMAAWERCAGNRDAALRLETEVLPRAEAASRAVERAFEQGEVSLLDVLDARRALQEVRRELLWARLLAAIDCTALAVLTGESDDAR